MMKQDDASPETISEMAGKKICDVFTKGEYVETGIRCLDEKLIGLFGGQLVVIAARPKKGKSALALQIIYNTGGLMFTLEMMKREIYSRLLSMEASVEAWRIESGQMGIADAAAVENARDLVKNKARMTVYDNVNEAAKIFGIIRRACEKEKLRLIVIDYLQLIRGARGDNQNLRIASITGALKGKALQYNIPIVLLSQLSRDSEKQNRAPMLSDLRDSGAIEQDADVVLFIHEEADGHQIIVGANRKGRTGKVRIKFMKPYTRFEEVGL
jgi:replicative DNA helicase